MYSVVEVEVSDGLGVMMGGDDFDLLEEELQQLSVKCFVVHPKGVCSLICSIWTKKTYHPDSFRAQIKSIWKTKRKFEIEAVGPNLFLVLFEDSDDLEFVLKGCA